MKLLFSSFLVLSLFNLCVVLKKNFFFLRILFLSVSYLVNFFKDYKVLLLDLKIENFRFFRCFISHFPKKSRKKISFREIKKLKSLVFSELASDKFKQSLEPFNQRLYESGKTLFFLAERPVHNIRGFALHRNDFSR